MFSEKLDFLMRLTNAQNSVLGRAILIDASTISRLRNGKRELPKKQNFLQPMSAYFTKHITEAYQMKAAAEAICPGQTWPKDQQRASSLLYSWLLEESTVRDTSISRLLTGLSTFNFPPVDPAALSVSHDTSTRRFYHGNAGKRDAVVAFLNTVAEASKPRTLLLYSNEPMDWLNEDVGFAKRWAQLLGTVIARGNRIRIIHTVKRAHNEMIDAFAKWMPLYMTGAIEPYYYPRVRDDVYRRTLFIAPELAAVESSAVGTHTQTALNQYIDDKQAVAALTDEFQHFFALCLPLMRIFKSQREKAWPLFTELNDAGGNSIFAHGSLPLFAMPGDVARAISERAGSDMLLRLQQQSKNAFEKNIARFTFNELVVLPSIDDVQAGKLAAPVIDLLDARKEVFYTKDEFVAHLENVIRCCKDYKNYRLILSDEFEKNLLLYCKERTGTLIARTGASPIIFAFNEPSITVSFAGYLEMLLGQNTKGDRSATIKRLSGMLSDL